MDTFDSAIGSFEQSTDQHNFMEYFQQQQAQQQQSSYPVGSLPHASNLPLASDSTNGSNGHSGNNGGAGSSKGAGGAGDLTSPTAALMRSSASPSSYEQLAGGSHGDTTAPTTATSDSPSPSYQHNPSSTGASKAAAGGPKMFAGSHQIHPMSTPIRQNSLPFDHLNHPQQQGRFMAGPSSRQLSLGSPSSNPGSPNMMRPPPPPSQAGAVASTGTLSNGTSPSSTEFLNPNAPMSASPSPLRTNLPFSAQSPENGARQSPTGTMSMKGEEGAGGGNDGGGFDRSQVVPSQSSMTASGYAMYPNGAHKDAAGPMGTPTQAGADGPGGAASTKFVHKLFRMVSDAEYQHLISWNASGTSVVVTNFDEFAKEVLGKHFKHSNFSSFIRQLNMYGFYKVNKTPRGHRHAVDTQVWEFSHPKFIRGHPELLDDIRRKALDSEHARVEARDLQYSVSVGHMQLRQQVDEQQYRIEELYEMNMALRQVVGGLRDTLSNVLEWVKVNNGGQLPFENRLPILDLPPTPMMHPYMQEAPNWGVHGPGPGQMAGPDMVGGDAPPIFVTEPSYGGQHPQAHHPHPHHQQSLPHDVFSMSAMGSVSPMGSRRVSAGSQHSEQMDGSNGAKLTLDTQMHFHNPGLGVMGLNANQSPMSSQMAAAINTPLPPSPAVHSHAQMGYVESSPFLASPSMASFPGQATAGYFGGANAMMADEEDGTRGPNAKAMRTPLKRTASNSGQHQMAVQSAVQNQAAAQQKRKSPGV